MVCRSKRIAGWFALSMVSMMIGVGAAQPVPTGTPIESDLDAFMAKVLERREVDWNRLHDYVFHEREVLELRGSGSAPIESLRREYVWLVRDGYLVRSPVRANGARVSEKDRQESERRWIEERKKKRQNSLERETFFGFKFQPGRYLLASRKKFEGRDVMVVEYYPKLSDLDDDADADPDKQAKKSDRDREEEEYYTRMFEKTLVVTMLIVPEEHQIVQMTFDNVGLDFLPGRWLVRVDDIRADMTMHQPFEKIWLPRAIHASGEVSTANGSFALHYSREFFDYQKTDVKVRFWYEKPKDEGKKP